MTTLPSHLPQEGLYCAVSALYSLSGKIVDNMDQLADRLHEEHKLSSPDVNNLQFTEPHNQGNYNFNVLEWAMSQLGLCFVYLPDSKQLQSQNEINIELTVQMPEFKGFLIGTGHHYFAYAKADNQMYNCDSRLPQPELITLKALRQQLRCHTCSKWVCVAVFNKPENVSDSTSRKETTKK